MSIRHVAPDGAPADAASQSTPPGSRCAGLERHLDVEAFRPPSLDLDDVHADPCTRRHAGCVHRSTHSLCITPRGRQKPRSVLGVFVPHRGPPGPGVHEDVHNRLTRSSRGLMPQDDPRNRARVCRLVDPHLTHEGRGRIAPRPRKLRGRGARRSSTPSRSTDRHALEGSRAGATAAACWGVCGGLCKAYLMVM